MVKGRKPKLGKSDNLVTAGNEAEEKVSPKPTSTKSPDPPKEPEKPKSPTDLKQQSPPQPTPPASPESVALKVVREDPPSLEFLPFQPTSTSAEPKPVEPAPPSSEEGKPSETPPTPEPIPTPTQEYSTPPPYQPPTGEEQKAGEPSIDGAAHIPTEVGKMTGKQTAQWFVDTYSLWVPEIADDYSKFDLEEIKNWVFNQKLPPEAFSMAEQANIDSRQSLQVPEVLQKWMVDSITPLCELRGFSASPEFIAGFAVVMVSFIIGKQAIKKHKIHEQFLRDGIEIMKAKYAPPKQEEKKDDRKKAA